MRSSAVADDSRTYSNFPKRLRVVGSVFALLGLIIAARLFYLQIIRHEDMHARLQKRLTSTEVALSGRGRILDRNGVVLAHDRPAFQLVLQVESLALNMGIVQELGYSLYKSSRKYRTFRQAGLPAPSEGEMLAKIDNLDGRLATEPLLLDLCRFEGIEIDDLTHEVKEALKKCARRWYYLSDTQVTDLYIPREAALKILAAPDRFAGFSCIQSAVRAYPQEELAAHSIGYLGRLNEEEYKIIRIKGELPTGSLEYSPLRLNNAERLSLPMVRHFLMGREGIELVFNNSLRGKVGRVREAKSIDGEKIVVEESIARDGDDIIMSLDSRLQHAAREAMDGRDGAVVLIDLDSGEVLVSVSLPTFNPDRITPPIDMPYYVDMQQVPGVFVNKVTRGLYPFGSVYKIVSAVAALESGVITPRSEYICQRVHSLTKLTCLGYHGQTDVVKALERSCNIFFYDAALEMGINNLHDTSLMFHLGQKPGSEMPYEKSGVSPNPYYKSMIRGHGPWVAGDSCLTAIGQGYQLGTPLQAAIVAGMVSRPKGVRTPTFVKGVRKPFLSLPVAESTRNAVREGMYRVVHAPHGTAHRASSDLVSFSGKSGTADTTNHKEGHPAYRPPHAWFAGFAPSDNPKVAFAVVVEHGGHGGDTAAPIAKKVLEAWARTSGRTNHRDGD